MAHGKIEHYDQTTTIEDHSSNGVNYVKVSILSTKENLKYPLPSFIIKNITVAEILNDANIRTHIELLAHFLHRRC